MEYNVIGHELYHALQISRGDFEKYKKLENDNEEAAMQDMEADAYKWQKENMYDDVLAKYGKEQADILYKSWEDGWKSKVRYE